MRITCPHCGTRDLIEFTYQGDAKRTRPELGSQDVEAWYTYVYDRINTRGRLKEYWQHHGGCRSHLLVERDTATHEILSVMFARDAVQGAKS